MEVEVSRTTKWRQKKGLHTTGKPKQRLIDQDFFPVWDYIPAEKIHPLVSKCVSIVNNEIDNMTTQDRLNLYDYMLLWTYTHKLEPTTTTYEKYLICCLIKNGKKEVIRLRGRNDELINNEDDSFGRIKKIIITHFNNFSSPLVGES